MKVVCSIMPKFFVYILLAVAWPGLALAQTDCISCHGDAGMQDGSGHSERGCTEVSLEHSRQPGMQQLPHCDQGISSSGQSDAGCVLDMPCG